MKVFWGASARCVLAAALLAGCSSDGVIFKRYDLNKDQSLSLDAEQRVINNVEIDPSEPGQVKPKRIVCAEPSPDVASSFSRAFTAGLNVALKEPKIEGQAAGQLSDSLSRSIAQLGERTATIQLLRDSLYRACEAYQNGAISGTGYALILSRYDVLTATLMLGEIGGAAFGRKQAAIDATARTGSASDADKQALTSARGELAAAQKDADDAQTNLAAAQKNAGPTPTPDQSQQINGPQATLATKQDAVARARTDVMVATLAVEGATAAGGFAQAGGGLDRTPTKDVAEQLGLMQERYLAHTQSDLGPLLATCITALDSHERRSSTLPFVATCQQFMGAIARSYPDVIKANEARAEATERTRKAAIEASAAKANAVRRVVDFCAKASTPEDKTTCGTMLQRLP